jgi:TIR domain
VRVFVSYRRSDVGGHAGRLSDALIDRLGRDKVFHDVSAIAAGRDFTIEIDAALASSDAVLAVIGPGWLSATTPDGQLRLFQPDDFVRSELVAALATDTPVVPVLVGGASMPTADQLPVELSRLAQRQAVVIRDEAFHGDVERLLQSLRGEQPATRPARFHVLIAGGLFLAIVGGATAGLWIWRQSEDPEGESGSELTGCPIPSGAEWNAISLNGKPSAVVEDVAGQVRVTVTDADWRTDEPGRWQVVLTTEMENNNTIDRQPGTWYYRSLVVSRRPFDPSCFDTAREEFTAPGQVADGHVGFLVTCAPRGVIDLVLNSPPSGEQITLPLTAAIPEECHTSSS